MSQPQGSLANLLKRNAAQRAMTHCKRNHEFTPDNTRITARGTRQCRTCARMLARGQKRAREGRAKQFLIDPVAIIRAANGDKQVYTNMIEAEKLALWNWVQTFHPEDFDGVYDRLFPGLSAYRYRKNAKRRIEEGRAILPDPEEMDLWRTLYAPPAREVGWAKLLGLDVDQFGRATMLKATRIDMVGGHRYNRPDWRA